MDIKRLENSQAELTMTLNAERIETEYDKKLAEYTKKIQIAGFRKGKAPSSLIESKYGKEIREEVTFKLMEDNLQETIKTLDKKDAPLYSSTPVLQNEDKLLPFKKGSDITYSVIYDVYPTINMPEKYTGLDVEVSIEDIDKEKLLNDRLKDIQERNAIVVPKLGAIESGDIVTLDYYEVDENGNKIEKKSEKDFIFTVDNSYNFFKLDKDIIGMKKDESKTIEKTYTEDMPDEYLNRNVKIYVEIKNVRTKNIPALDDELAQDVSADFKTLDDLKNSIKKQIDEELENDNKNIKLQAYLEKAVDPLNIVIPESLINSSLDLSWERFLRQYNADPKEIEEMYAKNGITKDLYIKENRTGAIKQLQHDIFIEEVSTINDFKIPEEDINAELEKQNIKKDDPNIDFIKTQMQDNLKFEKAVNFILDNNNFINKPKGEDNKNEN